MGGVYSPAWAPWCSGSFNERVVDRETGEVEPQLVQMSCSKCGATFQVKCMTGAVRKHIQNFALSHTHRQPLADPYPSRR